MVFNFIKICFQDFDKNDSNSCFFVDWTILLWDFFQFDIKFLVISESMSVWVCSFNNSLLPLHRYVNKWQQNWQFIYFHFFPWPFYLISWWMIFEVPPFYIFSCFGGRRKHHSPDMLDASWLLYIFFAVTLCFYFGSQLRDHLALYVPPSKNNVDNFCNVCVLRNTIRNILGTSLLYLVLVVILSCYFGSQLWDRLVLYVITE